MLFKKIERTAEPISDETISIRAYEIWQARGCPEGDGNDNWQAAQEQLAAEAEQTTERLGPLRRFWARLRAPAA